jgi:hypothetical protein
MKNEIYFENGIKHELTADEKIMLQHYIHKAYVEDILGLEFIEANADKVIDTGTLMKSESYQKFSNSAKALVNLYSLFYEHLD